MSLRGNDEEKDQDMPFSWQDFQRLLECTTSEDSLIPDNIVDYFIGKAGCTVTDPNVYRMISLSTHKFLHDLIVSARRYQDKGRPQTGQLRAESLLAALAAKGLVVNKIDFLAGN